MCYFNLFFYTLEEVDGVGEREIRLMAIWISIVLYSNVINKV